MHTHKPNEAFLLIVTSLDSSVWGQECGDLLLSADMAHCSSWTNKELCWYHCAFSVAGDKLMTSLKNAFTIETIKDGESQLLP